MSNIQVKKYLLAYTFLVASVVFLIQITMMNFPFSPVEAAVNDQDSGWDECNGWTDPRYNRTGGQKFITEGNRTIGRKLDCRDCALKRARGEGCYGNETDFYALGLALPPSGSKTDTSGPDLAWYNWGGWDPAGKTFLSEGTQCGLGPSVCLPSPTPTRTPKPSATPTTTPSSTPTTKPSATPTTKPSATPTTKPSVTPTNEVILCKLGDRVVYDENKNGLQEIFEIGVKNIKVELFDENMNLLRTDITGEKGYYRFTKLDCDKNYFVKFHKPANYIYSEQFVGDNKEIDSNANIETGISEKVYLTGTDLSIDALIYKMKDTPTPSVTPSTKPSATPTTKPSVTPTEEVVLCELGDRVVYDQNKNGLQEIWELGVKNIKVELYDESMNKLATQVTNNNGFYRFEELDCETNYYVKFYKPSDYKFSQAFVGANKEIDSNANVETGLSEKVYLTGTDLSIDALIYKEVITVSITPTVPVVTPTPGVKGEDTIFGFSIDKSIVGDHTYNVGELVTYKVVLENSGTQVINKVTMRDVYTTNMRVEAIYLVQNGTRRNVTTSFFANDSEMESGNILPRDPQDKSKTLDLTDITGDMNPGSVVTFEFIFKAQTKNSQVCNQAFASANDRSEIQSQKVCVTVDAIVPVTD